MKLKAPKPLAAGAALLPLRLFLGVTFVYAGVQKLSDPGFLHPGSTTYIGTQLHGFASGTPGGFLLRTFALPHPQLAGVGVALREIGLGLLTAVGLLTRAAAAAGLGLSLVLFLTNSWHTYPYFLGSDIVFVFAWLPFVLAGSGGQLALDSRLERLENSPRLRLAPSAPELPPLSRREVLARALGVAGAAALGIGGVAALAKGRYRGNSRTAALAQSPAPAANPPRARTRKATAPQLPRGAVRLGPSQRLPAGRGATYRDPGDGSADIVIRSADGQLRAFSAVCTHAGCTVGYDGSQIACPCHGGTFDPQTGAVTGGPPQQPLARRKVVESGGAIYAVPA